MTLFVRKMHHSCKNITFIQMLQNIHLQVNLTALIRPLGAYEAVKGLIKPLWAYKGFEAF